MGEQFQGKWISDTMENFVEYMKALDVGVILRNAGAHSTTYIDIEQNEGVWHWKYKIAFKSGELIFRLGEEFDEVTPDGRKVKSLMTMDGEMLHEIQRGKPCDTIIERTIDENGEMVEICKAKDVVCRRTYKRRE